MPRSKLRKAIGAVKDQTSISIAKVYNNNSAANLEVTIVKATSHEEIPIEDRYLNEILQLVAFNKVYAASCAQAIGKRIRKTKNWIVALKSLILVLRIFQDGDPYFPREVHAMKRGAKILNLQNFKDDSTSSPWDFTSFVRTFALYLEERLDCFLTGKLQRRFTIQDQEIHIKTHKKYNNKVVSDMKPVMLVDRITYWQKLLDRAIATKPTGTAKTNRLVKISLYAIVQESFDLYKDISNGLALILDSFFHLQYNSCVNAFQSCVKASKQFDELSEFYAMCKSIGIGKTSEYPSIQKVSEELIETLQEFLKDQASFSNQSQPSSNLGYPLIPPNRSKTSSLSERNYGLGSTSCTSLDDLMSSNTLRSPTRPVEFEKYLSHIEDFVSAYDIESNNSQFNDQAPNFMQNFVSFDDCSELEETQKHGEYNVNEKCGQVEEEASRDGWELVLFQTTNQQIHTSNSNVSLDGLESSSLVDTLSQKQYNPFVDDLDNITPQAISASTSTNDLSGFPGDLLTALDSTFHSNESNKAPTFELHDFSSEVKLAMTLYEGSTSETTMVPAFCAQNQSEPTFRAKKDIEMSIVPSLSVQSPNLGNDLFECSRSVNQEMLLQEQQLWLENQSKIIAKHFK